MIEKAFAKINLSLDIKNKRDDGYHNLETIMLPISLHDSLEISIIKNGYDDFITCDNFNLEISKYNLCHLVIEEARKKWGFNERFKIHIHKSIFLQAGLGGGSADAAATLRGIIKLLKIQTTEQEMIDLVLPIGSDIPFALFNKPALVKSKGENIEFFDYTGKPIYFLVIKPKEGLSTSTVFNKSDELGYKTYNEIGKIKSVFLNEQLENLKNIVFNSLEDAAITLVPSIKELKESLINDGFDCVLMSGSGSSVFGLTYNFRLVSKKEIYYFKKGYEVEIGKVIL